MMPRLTLRMPTPALFLCVFVVIFSTFPFLAQAEAPGVQSSVGVYKGVLPAVSTPAQGGGTAVDGGTANWCPPGTYCPPEYAGANYGAEGGYGGSALCPQDAKQCPNGAYVVRMGPSCAFTCPADFDPDRSGIIAPIGIYQGIPPAVDGGDVVPERVVQTPSAPAPSFGARVGSLIIVHILNIPTWLGGLFRW